VIPSDHRQTVTWDRWACRPGGLSKPPGLASVVAVDFLPFLPPLLVVLLLLFLIPVLLVRKPSALSRHLTKKGGQTCHYCKNPFSCLENRCPR
jgi:hypothetical protein